MRVVDVIVVYESVFGNTRMIAEAIADGARQAGPDIRVAVMSATEAAPDKVGEAGLVVAGGPAHMRGMNKPSTRRKAMRAVENPAAGSQHRVTAAPRAGGPGLREWLDALPRASQLRMAPLRCGLAPRRVQIRALGASGADPAAATEDRVRHRLVTVGRFAAGW
jgi:hypothetical protein